MLKKLWHLVRENKDWVLAYILSFLFFFLPLIFSTLKNSEFNYPKIFFSISLISSFILLFAIFFWKNNQFLIDKTLFSIIIFFIFSLSISTIFSNHFVTSFFGLQASNYIYSFLYTFTEIIFAMVVYLWLKSIKLKKRMKIITTIILYAISGNIISSLFNIQEIIINYSTLFTTFRLRGTMGEPNRMGFYIAVMTPLSIYLVKSEKKLIRIIGWVSFCLSLITIITTFTRGSWIVLILTILISQIKNLSRTFKNRIYKIFLIITIIGVFIASPLGNRVQKHILSAVSNYKNSTGSLSIRLDEWKDSINLINNFSIKEHFIGLGPQNGSYSTLKYKKQHIGMSSEEKHWRIYTIRNHYIEILMTQGLVGFISWILYIYLTIIFYLHSKNQNIKWIFYGWLSIIIMGFIYHITIMLFPFLFFTSGIIFSNYKNSISIIRLNFKYLRYILVVWCVFVIVISSLYYFADTQMYKFNNMFGMKYIPWESLYYRQRSINQIGKFKTLKDQLLLVDAINASEHAINNNNLEVENYSAAWNAYFYSAVHTNNLDHLKKAYNIAKIRLIQDPGRAMTYDEYAQTLLHMGEVKKSKLYFEKALKIDSEYYYAYLHLGEVYKQLKNYSEAINYYRKALEIRSLTSEYINGKISEIIDLQQRQ